MKDESPEVIEKNGHIRWKMRVWRSFKIEHSNLVSGRESGRSNVIKSDVKSDVKSEDNVPPWLRGGDSLKKRFFTYVFGFLCYGRIFGSNNWKYLGKLTKFKTDFFWIFTFSWHFVVVVVVVWDPVGILPCGPSRWRGTISDRPSVLHPVPVVLHWLSPLPVALPQTRRYKCHRTSDSPHPLPDFSDMSNPITSYWWDERPSLRRCDTCGVGFEMTTPFSI